MDSINLKELEVVPSDEYLFIEEVPNLHRYAHTASGARPPVLDDRLVGSFRRLSHFVYTDVFAVTLQHLLLPCPAEEHEEAFYLLHGRLLPQSSAAASAAPIAVRIAVRKVVVVYGSGESDPLRGLWVSSAENDWFQLVAPSHDKYTALWRAVTRKLFPLHATMQGRFNKRRIALIEDISLYNGKTNRPANVLDMTYPYTPYTPSAPSSAPAPSSPSKPVLLQGRIPLHVGGDEVRVHVSLCVDSYEFSLDLRRKRERERERDEPEEDEDSENDDDDEDSDSSKENSTHTQQREKHTHTLWLRASGGDVWYRVASASPSFADRYARTLEEVAKYMHPEKKILFRDDSPIARATQCALWDAQGCAVPFVFRTQGRQVFLLQAVLVANKSRTFIAFSAFVDAYVIDLSEKTLDHATIKMRPPYSLCVHCTQQRWFKVDSARFADNYACAFLPTQDALHMLLQSYDWCETAGEQWLRVDDFSLWDAKSKRQVPLIKGFEPNRPCVLRGQLMHPSRSDKSPKQQQQQSCCVPLDVQVEVSRYSIDYGVVDGNRGLWLQDTLGVWYKVLTPCADYADIATEDLDRTERFLDLYDIVALKFSTKNHHTGLLSCKKSILDIYLACRGDLDLDFVERNKTFIISNLEGAFDEAASKNLHSSIKRLNKKEIHKAVTELFVLLASQLAPSAAEEATAPLAQEEHAAEAEGEMEIAEQPSRKEETLTQRFESHALSQTMPHDVQEDEFASASPHSSEKEEEDIGPPLSRSGKKVGGRQPGVTNYTLEEINLLLDIVEKYRPTGSSQWDALAQEYNRTNQHGQKTLRSGDGLTRKFYALINNKKRGKDGEEPPEVLRARQIASAMRSGGAQTQTQTQTQTSSTSGQSRESPSADDIHTSISKESLSIAEEEPPVLDKMELDTRSTPTESPDKEFARYSPAKESEAGQSKTVDVVQKPIARRKLTESQDISVSFAEFCSSSLAPLSDKPATSSSSSTAAPSASSSSPQEKKLCPYCRGISKRPMCGNVGHIDGFPLDESKVTENFCRYCHGLKKHPRCFFKEHIDGKTVRPTFSSVVPLPKPSQPTPVLPEPAKPAPVLLSTYVNPRQVTSAIKQYQSYKKTLEEAAEPVSALTHAAIEGNTNRKNRKLIRTTQLKGKILTFQWKQDKIDLSLVPSKSSMKKSSDSSVAETSESTKSEKLKVRWLDENTNHDKSLSTEIITFSDETTTGTE